MKDPEIVFPSVSVKTMFPCMKPSPNTPPIKPSHAQLTMSPSEDLRACASPDPDRLVIDWVDPDEATQSSARNDCVLKGGGPDPMSDDGKGGLREGGGTGDTTITHPHVCGDTSKVGGVVDGETFAYGSPLVNPLVNPSLTTARRRLRWALAAGGTKKETREGEGQLVGQAKYQDSSIMHVPPQSIPLSGQFDNHMASMGAPIGHSLQIQTGGIENTPPDGAPFSHHHHQQQQQQPWGITSTGGLGVQDGDGGNGRISYSEGASMRASARWRSQQVHQQLPIATYGNICSGQVSVGQNIEGSVNNAPALVPTQIPFKHSHINSQIYRNTPAITSRWHQTDLYASCNSSTLSGSNNPSTSFQSNYEQYQRCSYVPPQNAPTCFNFIPYQTYEHNSTGNTNEYLYGSGYQQYQQEDMFNSEKAPKKVQAKRKTARTRKPSRKAKSAPVASRYEYEPSRRSPGVLRYVLVPVKKVSAEPGHVTRAPEQPAVTVTGEQQQQQFHCMGDSVNGGNHTGELCLIYLPHRYHYCKCIRIHMHLSPTWRCIHKEIVMTSTPSSSALPWYHWYPIRSQSCVRTQ